MSEIERADEAACKLDGMFRDIFNQQERRDLIYVIITASDAYRAEQKRKNCRHLNRFGGGGIGESGSHSYWRCPECGESYDSRAALVSPAERQGEAS